MKSVLVKVAGISVCAPYHGYVVILKEKNSERWLPIYIGHPEAQTISLLMQGIKIPRPLTYDMFHSIISSSDAKVEKVTVTNLKENTFFAEISLKIHNDKIVLIDARPSDAIALAIKTEAPIYVNEKMMEEAGMVGEFTAQSHVSMGDKLQDLSKQLEDAVENEKYEEAAELRDKINAIKSEQTSTS